MGNRCEHCEQHCGQYCEGHDLQKAAGAIGWQVREGFQLLANAQLEHAAAVMAQTEAIKDLAAATREAGQPHRVDIALGVFAGVTVALTIFALGKKWWDSRGEKAGGEKGKAEGGGDAASVGTGRAGGESGQHRRGRVGGNEEDRDE